MYEPLENKYYEFVIQENRLLATEENVSTSAKNGSETNMIYITVLWTQLMCYNMHI